MRVPNSVLLFAIAMFSLALSQPALGQEKNTTAAPYIICTRNTPPMVRIRSTEQSFGGLLI